MGRQCLLCRRELVPDNSGKLCVVCADKLKDVMTDLPEVLDVEDVREILHLEDAETVRRKHRRGDLPACIPSQKKLLWPKDDFVAWMKSGGQTATRDDLVAWMKSGGQTATRDDRIIALQIASNLRMSLRDQMRAKGSSDKIGNLAYGAEPIYEITPLGLGQLVELVKVHKVKADNVLTQLPKGVFPELGNVAGWDDLTYGEITEDFIIRLESYF